MWRQTLWAQGQRPLEEAAHALQGTIEQRWSGWVVRAPRGEWRVEGGLSGVRSVLRRKRDGAKEVRKGWVQVSEVVAFIAG